MIKSHLVSCHSVEPILPPDPGHDSGTRIDPLSLSNMQFRNETGKPAALLRNDGSIGKLYLYDVDAGKDEVLVNGGTIGKVEER